MLHCALFKSVLHIPDQLNQNHGEVRNKGLKTEDEVKKKSERDKMIKSIQVLGDRSLRVLSPPKSLMARFTFSVWR